ncbi:MAG: hypothetical protein RIT45_205 [Pseudomonadota bacterium]|jgi:RimJ/RimL family protein N-acetyltransferase
MTSHGARLTIRRARFSDAARLCDFKRLALRETEFLLQGPEDWLDDVPAERSLIEAFVNHDRSVLLLAVLDDGDDDASVVGMISIVGGPFRRNAHVGQLGMGVLRSQWRRGVGRALLDASLRWAAGPGGLEKVSLQVHADNHPARRLYESSGFVAEGVLAGEALLGEALCDLVVMGRFLADLREVS